MDESDQDVPTEDAARRFTMSVVKQADELQKISERFSRRPPLSRSSQLGMLLVLISLGFEFLSRFRAGDNAVFAPAPSYNIALLAMGIVLIVVGVIGEIYLQREEMKTLDEKIASLESDRKTLKQRFLGG